MAPILPALLSVLALVSSLQVDASPFGSKGAAGNRFSKAKRAFSGLSARYYGDKQGMAPPPSLGFKKRAEYTVPAGWDYVGCASESNGVRLLQGWSYSSSIVTPLQCLTMCGGAGFTLGGMENGNECYCGNAYVGDGGYINPDTQCAMACSGDSSQDCGAAWRLSMYRYTATGSTGCTVTTPTTSHSSASSAASTSASVTASKTSTSAAVSSTPTFTDSTDSSEWYSLGCAIDSATRIMSGSFTDSPSMTIDSCLVSCEDAGFTYAGLQYGTQCFCSSTLASTVTYDADSSCWMACGGNSRETCGAGYRMDVYELISSSLEYCDTTSTSTSATATRALAAVNNLVVTGVVAATRGASDLLAAATRARPTASLVATGSSATATATTSALFAVSSAAAPAPSATGEVRTVSTNIPSTSRAHYVWAHFMVGNCYMYNSADWATDIAQAKAAGIDGFALNLGSDSWQPNRVADAYAAAAAAGGFKMFLSLDMTSLSCNSMSDGQNLVNLVNAHAYSSAQAMYNGKALVSTFSGENCYFGQSSVSAGWTNAFRAQLPNIFFSPSIFSDISTFSSNSWMDGELNWNSAWPMGGSDLTTAGDQQYISALGGKDYMAAISPFFYTHFAVEYWGGKNWLYRGDDWLFCERFEQLISMRDQISQMEILTWNDWGESSYLTNIPTGSYTSDMPSSSSNWVQNFEHTALLPLSTYYSTAFKTGSYPTVTKDQIILWSRPHPYDAVATSDPSGRPTGWQNTQDYVWAAVLSTGGATVTLKSGSNTESYTVKAGLSKIKIPNGLGSMSGTVVRNGVTVASYDAGSAFSYTTTPAMYNYNYFVGGSS